MGGVGAVPVTGGWCFPQEEGRIVLPLFGVCRVPWSVHVGPLQLHLRTDPNVKYVRDHIWKRRIRKRQQQLYEGFKTVLSRVKH